MCVLHIINREHRFFFHSTSVSIHDFGSVEEIYTRMQPFEQSAMRTQFLAHQPSSNTSYKFPFLSFSVAPALVSSDAGSKETFCTLFASCCSSWSSLYSLLFPVVSSPGKVSSNFACFFSCEKICEHRNFISLFSDYEQALVPSFVSVAKGRTPR